MVEQVPFKHLVPGSSPGLPTFFMRLFLATPLAGGMGFDLADGIKWYLVFLFSTSFHEAAHAWAALKLGDDTAARGGQVSLDPTPHIRRSPLGMVVVPLCSYFTSGWMIGWASAPYDPQWAAAHPRRAALMGVAGPLANLILLLAAAFVLRMGLEWHVFHSSSFPDFLHVVQADDEGVHGFFAKLVSLVFSLNLLLFLFNLIPLPPLDGSVLPLFFLPPAWAERYFEIRRHPGLLYLGLFLSWKLFGVVYPPIQALAVNCLYWGL